MKLELDKIRRDGGTQPRAALRIDVIEEYAERMRAGVRFPPITVFYDGKHHWLADGFHRVAATSRAKPDEPIEADVIQGALADAQWYSFGVNRAHGLRRTNEDIERVVTAALGHPNAASLSNVQIAEHCGVSEITVRRYRKKMEPSSTMSKMRTVTRGGTSYRQNAAHIGKNSKRSKDRNRISRSAMKPVLAHSLPNPMIPLSLPPGNPVIAAATIFQLFERSFVRTLIDELSKRLEGAKT